LTLARSAEIDATVERPRPYNCLIRSVHDRSRSEGTDTKWLFAHVNARGVPMYDVQARIVQVQTLLDFSALFAAQPSPRCNRSKADKLAFCHGIVSLLFELARLVLSWRSRQQALRRDSSPAFFKVSSPPTMDRDNRSQT